MENNSSLFNRWGLKESFGSLLKKISVITVLALSFTLTSCTATYRNRGYDTYDRDGYYQRQGDVGYGDRWHSRAERNRWEREHRRWHRLHDRDYNNYDRDRDHDDEGGIIIGR